MADKGDNNDRSECVAPSGACCLLHSGRHIPPASAADISRCDGSNGVSDTLESGYRDLGNGYVSYYQQSLDFFSEPDSVSGTVVVEACASGKVIYAPVYYCVDGAGGKCDKKTSYDFRTAAVTLLDKAAGAEPTTFDDLVTRLTKINPETSVEPVGEYGSESCACHVAYPRLRGDKPKFSFPKD